jgi:hypothetical protein
MEKNKVEFHLMSLLSSVVDPDPHGSEFVWLSWIRIRIGNAGPEPDPGPAFPKLT